MKYEPATWRGLISEEMEKHGDTWDDVVHSALEHGSWTDSFDHGYGCHNGSPFTLWTTKRVYFPAVYDGAEWVASAPRNPCNEAVKHVGGE